jgi:hypothetical protein
MGACSERSPGHLTWECDTKRRMPRYVARYEDSHTTASKSRWFVGSSCTPHGQVRNRELAGPEKREG